MKHEAGILLGYVEVISQRAMVDRNELLK